MGNRCIIGLGNYAKNDDGIGLRIIEHIVDSNLDDGFDAVEIGNDGIRLLNYLEQGYEKVVLIDCALVGEDPGNYLRFDIDDVATQKQVDGFSTHEGDILKVVDMARKMEYKLPQIRVFAIQPESLGMDMTLSDKLQSRFSEYVEAVIEEVKK